MALSPFVILVGGIFILGTYIVAVLDDLLRMRASRSFLYIWFLIAAGLGVYGYFDYGEEVFVRVAVSVMLFLVFYFGLLRFKLAIGDIIAMLPVVFLLPYLYIGIFLAAVLAVDRLVLRFVYTTLQRRLAYPFMPAIFLGLAISLVAMLIFTPEIAKIFS